MKKLSSVLAIILTLTLLIGIIAPSVCAIEGEEPFRISAVVNGDSCTEKGLAWYTKVKTDSVVEIYKENEQEIDNTVKIEYDDVFEFEGNYVHKAKVSNLERGKTYNYRVGSSNTLSDLCSFETDDGDSSFNFIAISDVQAKTIENFMKGADTLKTALKMMPEAEFIIDCGDFTDDSDNEQWDLFYEAFGEIYRNNTLVPVAGNHDGSGVWHWFNNMFNLDNRESVQNLSGVNYSFDYGNAHFAVVNTNDLMAVSYSQLIWLKNDLNSTDKDWKIVLMHKSPYSFGKDAKWPDVNYLQKVLPLVLDSCNVDLVMSGHDHQYLRTKPLKNNKVSDDGTTYALIGTAGAKRYEIRPFIANHYMKTDYIAALTVQKNGWGNYWNGTDWNSTKDTNVGGCFNTINIDGGTLTFNSYILSDEMVNDDDSRVVTNIDSFTLTKETGQNKITFTGDNTTSKAEYYLGAIPSFGALATYSFGVWLPKFFIMLPALLDSVINDDIF